MKLSNKKILALSLILLGFIPNIEAQVTTVGNGVPGAAVDYCGWNATRFFPLTVAHKGNFPINFQTNGTQRMTIMNTTGFVGIGLSTPASLLHLNSFSSNSGNLFRTDGSNTVVNQWQMYTGATTGTVTEKLRLFIPANSNDAFMQTVQNGSLIYATNNENHLKINPDISYAVNSSMPPSSKKGFTLITNNQGIFTGTGNPPLFSSTYGPHSLLHLVGDDGNLLQTGGYREWMRNGLTVSNNFDAGFFGVRKMPNLNGGTNDVSDLVIAWSDNPSTGYAQAPDNLVFNFVAGDGNGSDLVGNSLYGRETMRHTSWGNIGIGPRFNNSFQPQSTLHQHQENAASSWMQITNQFCDGVSSNVTAPTLISAADGLKWGILGNSNNLMNANAFIYNQEERHLIFSTNHVNPTDPSSTFERMRITSIGAPTTLPSGYGVFNPGSFANTDLTRIAISHNPSNPVTRPQSLLHLGYNTPGGTDLGGWRSWMDVGIFTNNSISPNTGISMYSGIKINPFPNASGDAVIGWGYDPSNASLIPTRMRILFTTNTTGTTVAAGTNGIEAAHFWSDGNNTRMGVGDFMNGTTDLDPDNTLEIKSSTASPYWSSNNASGLRFTNLTSADNVVVPNATNAIDPNKVLSVDKSGDVVLIAAEKNIGNICGATTPNQNPLADNWEIIMQNRNYIFRDPELGSTGFGKIVGCNLGNTVEIAANANSPYGTTNSSGLRFKSLTSTSTTVLNGTAGVNSSKLLTVDDDGDVVLTSVVASSFGIAGNYCNGVPNPMPTDFNVPLNGHRYSFSAPGTVNIGTFVGCTGPFAAALYVRNSGATTTNIAFRADNAPFGAGAAWAGYFTGNVFCTNTVSATGGFVSDGRIKKDVLGIDSALNTIRLLNPVTFKFDNSYAPQLQTNATNNYGFIAQQVEGILPELVTEYTIAESYDSLGNIIDSTKTLKSLNYSGIIPILTKGIQEQQTQIEYLDSIVGEMSSGSSGITAASNGLSVSSANVQFGGNASNPTQINDAKFITDRDIFMNNKNLVFSDGGSTSGLNNGIQIGGSTLGILGAKLDVRNNNFNDGVYVQTTSSTGGNNHGLVGTCSGGINNVGLSGRSASTATENTGINGLARNGSSINYGGDFTAYSDGNTNIGVIGRIVSGTGTGNNYAIYGTAPAITNHWAGYFNGNVNVNGSYYQSNVLFTSDQMFKTNVQSINNASDIISQLQPKEYYFDTTNAYGMNFSSKKQYGLIAQEVETVLPELVGTFNKPADYDTLGNVEHPAVTYKTMNYNALFGIMLKGIQEQQSTINFLKQQDSVHSAQLTQLMEMMNACCQSQSSRSQTPNMMDVELSDKDVIVLNQNVPNPFAEQTTITYNIPEKAGFAQIIFNDMKGQIIKVVDIKTKGKGQLNVFANDLSNGMYSYTLYIDGKQVDTKKMVKTE